MGEHGKGQTSTGEGRQACCGVWCVERIEEREREERRDVRRQKGERWKGWDGLLRMGKVFDECCCAGLAGVHFPLRDVNSSREKLTRLLIRQT
jgi:hypothetical protein